MVAGSIRKESTLRSNIAGDHDRVPPRQDCGSQGSGAFTKRPDRPLGSSRHIRTRVPARRPFNAPCAAAHGAAPLGELVRVRAPYTGDAGPEVFAYPVSATAARPVLNQRREAGRSPSEPRPSARSCDVCERGVVNIIFATQITDMESELCR